ncbi:homoserine O-acetyltransferase MetX [Nocardioides ferulae]|uniref:homoserine O-acetyltransferase MetX n=1 Tax=Nocardioides ferulae TaxID=2340821 RepID=UPI000EB06353|nr:homoserine O-acetyltransferase [Nocardioides ferulae]
MSSLGYVELQRVLLATAEDPLLLRAGGRLDHVEVAYETYGELNAARDNAVFVCHALTGDAHAAGMHLGAKRRGWWDNLIGPGKPLDTRRFFVVSANLLGGCAGTTGPSSPNPATGRPYGLDFPLLHMQDLVTVHRRLLRHLGIERLYAAVGGSLGGMQVLQWVIDEPEQIERAVIVAASAQLSTENIAFSTVAREAIRSDPEFHDGRYLEHGTIPRTGLKVARMLAHITYVSDQALAAKFGHERDTTGDAMRLEPDYSVEHYLQHQGSSFVERFDALSYLYLTRLLDYFEPFADPATGGRLSASSTRFQVTSFDSDWRFDTRQSVHLVAELRRLGLSVDFTELRSPWGHDSFLLEPPGYHDRIRSFLAS